MKRNLFEADDELLAGVFREIWITLCNRQCVHVNDHGDGFIIWDDDLMEAIHDIKEHIRRDV